MWVKLYTLTGSVLLNNWTEHAVSGRVAISDPGVKDSIPHLSNYQCSSLYTRMQAYISNEQEMGGRCGGYNNPLHKSTSQSSKLVNLFYYIVKGTLQM